MNHTSDSRPLIVDAIVLDDSICFTLDALCQACQSDRMQVTTLVHEGVLDPVGSGPDDWQFAGSSLRRARTALRLLRDLELGVVGTALVLDLLDEIDGLNARLRRAGLG
ncbi:MAG: MerR family transcriptional regulator [Rhizobacter sp.]|nr:MerR family transcriptional regulator [Rhizobacter sp.]MBP6269900.1 MerR family transcriptional regulator [Rhizobacter sp.]